MQFSARDLHSFLELPSLLVNVSLRLLSVVQQQLHARDHMISLGSSAMLVNSLGSSAMLVNSLGSSAMLVNSLGFTSLEICNQCEVVHAEIPVP